MRQEIIDGINTLSLGTFNLSDKLPWDESGTALYLKNLKTIYVSEEEEEDSDEIATLSGLTFGNRVTTVRVYFAVDAKQKPGNFNTVTNAIRDLKDLATITGVTARECDHSNTIEGDVLVKEFEFRFTEFLA